jgi:tetratricopeptide (TPR) repeat protein
LTFSDIKLLIEQGRHDKASLKLKDLSNKTNFSNSELLNFNFLQSLLFLKEGNYSKAKNIAEGLITDIDSEVTPELWIESAFIISEASVYLSIPNEGIQILNKCRPLIDNLPDSDKKLLRMHNLKCFLGLLYGLRGEGKLGLEYILESIDTIQKESKLKTKQQSEILADSFLKLGMLSRFLDKFEDSKNYYNKSLVYYEKLNNLYGLGVTYHQLGLLYYLNENFNQALEVFSKSLEIRRSIGNKLDIALSYHRIGAIYKEMGEFLKALEYLKLSLKLREEMDSKESIAASHVEIANNYYNRGDLDLAINHYNKAIDLFSNLGMSKSKGDAINKKGIIFQTMGKIDQALELHEEGLNLFTEGQDKLGIPYSLLFLGQTLIQKGDLFEANMVLNDSLALFKELNYNSGCAWCYLKLALISLLKQDEKAQKYYQQSLTLFNKVDNQLGASEALFWLGIIHKEKKDQKNSEKFMEKALTIFKKNIKYFSLVENYYRLILVALKNQIIVPYKFFNELESILKKSWVNKRVDQRRRFMKSLFLKDNKRFKSSAEAQTLLKGIVEEELVDHETTALAYVNLIDILIFELRIYQNDNIFSEAKKYVKKLIEMTEGLKLNAWLVQAYLLQAQLMLLEPNLTQAKELLISAKQITEEKELRRLNKRVIADLDQLNKQWTKWEEIIEQKVSLDKRIEFSQIDSVLDRMLKGWDEELNDLTKEKPIFFIIITTSGVSYYSYAFKDETSQTHINDLLIGGFLSAINTFSQELFDSKTTIEKIKYQDYTILVKTVIPFLISYVYQGVSYFASKKLQDFIIHIQKDKHLYDLLIRSHKSAEVVGGDDKILMDNLVKNTFDAKIDT